MNGKQFCVLVVTGIFFSLCVLLQNGIYEIRDVKTYIEKDGVGIRYISFNKFTGKATMKMGMKSDKKVVDVKDIIK